MIENTQERPGTVRKGELSGNVDDHNKLDHGHGTFTLQKQKILSALQYSCPLPEYRSKHGFLTLTLFLGPF